MIALLLAAALADDVATDPLADELHRAATELALPGAPPLYHLRFLRTRLDTVSAHASRGALVTLHDAVHHTLSIAVRVGSPAFDNTGMGGWDTGFGWAWLPEDPTPHALRVAAWQGVDGAYKDAVEQYSRKVAQVDRDDDHPGDYTLTGPVVADGAPVPLADDAHARVGALAVSLSEGLDAVGGLTGADVFVGYEAGADWVLDTEGTRVVRPRSEVSVRAVATAVTEDGQVVVGDRLETHRGLGSWGDAQALADAGRALGRRVAEAAAAPRFTGEYVGPVVFEDRAAIELFRWLLRPQLEGTPPDDAFETFFGDLDDGRTVARVGRRVLPSGWSVVDDPTAWPDHPGTYRHDVEGTPAEPVTLVTDGIVRTLLTSRVPHPNVPDGTNGHARARFLNRAVGTISHLTVQPGRVQSKRRLERSALQAARAYGLDHVLVVRHMMHPALLARTLDGGLDGEIVLPPPLAVERLYADGHRELLRGVRFSAVDRRALRDIVAAGPMVAADVLCSVDGRDEELGPVEGFPARIMAPVVVVAELELVASPGDADRVPRVAAEVAR